MTWTPVAIPHEEVTATFLYELAGKHRLVRENIANEIESFKHLSLSCAVVLIQDDDTKDEVAHVVFSDIVDNEEAMLDFIPQAKYFGPKQQDFRELISEALVPVLDMLIEKRGLRRISAEVPRTRNRTQKALIACGFKKEGVKREGVKFRGKEAEDLINMGLLAKKG